MYVYIVTNLFRAFETTERRKITEATWSGNPCKSALPGRLTGGQNGDVRIVVIKVVSVLICWNSDVSNIC